MKKFSKFALALTGTLLCLSSVEASNQPTTFIGPTLRGGYTAPINDMTAYSIAGEVGVKNFRIGATLGFRIDPTQRIKFTGEYLWQRINYHFFTGDTERWVNQGAVGGRYEYDFTDVAYNPQFDLNAYYSHAPSENLSNRGGFTTVGGVATTFLDVRRLAGSDAGGASPGISFMPWDGGRLEIDANYDNVSYDTKNTKNEDAKGWGGTAIFKQIIVDNVLLGLTYANRKPFDDYEASLDWTNVQYYGRWTLGVYGDYLSGKNTLPNTWNLGLSADYFMDPIAAAPLKGENLKGVIPAAPADNFLNWTADPAVHMPQVLAIPDEKVLIPDPNACAGGVPALTGVSLSQTVPRGGVTTINATTAFTGTGLTYAFSTTGALNGTVVTPNVPTPGSVNVNTAVTGTGGALFTVNVTASNACGTAVTSFTVGVPGIAIAPAK